MAKKKKKRQEKHGHDQKSSDNTQHGGRKQRDDRVEMGNFLAEDRSQEPALELSPKLTEAIDAAFDEELAEEITAQVEAEIEAGTTGKTSTSLAGALSPQKTSKSSPVKIVLNVAGSMVVAILLMAIMAVVLAWATFVENAYGPNVSLFAIYRTWWFDVLLALLGVNVLCSMLGRLPWRRGQVPFVIAHVGILILLIGCFVTSRYGIEAQLTVFEGSLGRFAQKMAGDEIELEIIDFLKADDETQDKSQENSDADSAGESAHERWAKEQIAAHQDQTKIKPPGQHLQPELDVLGHNERRRFPVTLGPMSWREYESRQKWYEGKTPDGLLGWHSPTTLVYKPLQMARRSEGIVHDRNGIRVELLDYLADSRMKPAKQLKLRVQSNDARNELQNAGETETLTWATHELPLGVAAEHVRNPDLYLASLPQERISYRLAKSNAETRAFLELPKEPAAGIWGSIVMWVGGQKYAFPVDELINRYSEFAMTVNMTQRQLQSAELAATSLRLQLLAPDEKIDVDEIKKRLEERETEIEELKTKLADLNEKVRTKIGETGLSLEMTRFQPDMLHVVLVITRRDETPYFVALPTDQPLAATIPDALGMQIMHVFDPEAAAKDPAAQGSEMAFARASQPRLDLLQGRDQQLYYRFWDGRKYAESGEMPTDQKVLALTGGDGSTLNVAVEDYEPHDYPGYKLVAEPYKKPDQRSMMMPVPCVKVRVRVDGVGDETYWLQKTPYLYGAANLQEHQVGYVPGQNRTVAVTFPQAWLDLGFSLFLHKFERKLEPGIGTPSHFSSLVSVYPIDDEKADTTDREPLHNHVLIRMNQPGMFSDQVSGRKYRVFQSSYQGPYHPGMQRYEVGTGGYLIDDETQPRESLYASTLTANYDPGRGLKYLGCLMIVLGSLALFYTKKVRRKIGLTPLESTSVESTVVETMPNGFEREAATQRSTLKRVSAGHAMFFVIGLLIAFNIAAGTPISQNEEESPDVTVDAPLDVNAEITEENATETDQKTVAETKTEDTTETVTEAPEQKAATEETTLQATTSKNAAAVVAAVSVPPMPEPFDASNLPVSSRAIDWQAWEELPVFYDGRIMPLATFARIIVTNVCGNGDPIFELDTNVIEEALREELISEREANRIRVKFANGPRRFRNSELIFSWLVEPEVWEYIPFLAAENRELRTEVKAKTDGSRSDGPKHVSPYQVKKCAVDVQRIIDQWQKVEAEKLDDFELEKMGEDGLKALKKTGPAAMELYNSYTAYRMLTNEANTLPVFSLYQMLAQADQQVQNAYRMQLTLERLPVDFEKLGHAIPFSGRNELGLLYRDINDLSADLQRSMRSDGAEPITTQKLEAAFEKLIATFDRHLPEAERFRDAMFAINPRNVPREVGLREGMIIMLRNQSEQLCYSMRQSRQWCVAAYLSLYDAGARKSRACTLRLYPVLVDESIKTDRSYPVLSYDGEYSETNRMPTWLTLHTFLFGSDDMLRRFAMPSLPEQSLDAADQTDKTMQETRLPDYDGTTLTLIARAAKAGNPRRSIRQSFYEMTTAWLAQEYSDLYASDDKESKQQRREDRGKHIEAFNRAAIAFANNLRANAEATAEWRSNLVPREMRDDELLAKTAYPTRKLMRAEYNYERMQPFYLMWVASATALALLLVSAIVSLFHFKDRTLEAFFFWGGFIALILSEIVTLTGACYRAYITGWAPVTNMFETIVLMAFSVAVIGIWYAFQPLFGERLLRAWRVAALPKGSTGTQNSNGGSLFGNVSAGDELRFRKLQLIAFVPRLVLAVITLYYIMLLSYGEAGGGKLRWSVVQTSLAMTDPIDTAVVLISIALLVWLVPRAIVTLVMFPFVGKTGGKTAGQRPMSLHHALLNRKLFLIVGAALALSAGLAAYFNNTTFSPNIRPLMAVLRSNFWLTIHVFVIIVGYAAGAIAWLLAVVACGHCIFGRWGTTQGADGRYVPQIPDRAESLMPYIINMLRWTMLLVAIGTMLGARWADYSWGRFWGWDPKEVWALITLLFYLIVLHGRAARYYGNFGTMLGALFGAITIIMTWYGANVIFKGSRHAYGGADTSFETTILLIFIGVNLFWGCLALIRYVEQKTRADVRNSINTK